MEAAELAIGNSYSLHFALLQRQILEAATADYECLCDAGEELTEGWLQAVHAHGSDCRTFVSFLDQLQHLYMAGVLSTFDRSSAVPNMQGHDIFLHWPWLKTNAPAPCLPLASGLTGGAEPNVQRTP